MELLVERETESSTFGNGYDRPIPSQLNYSSMEYTIEYLMSEAKNEKKKEDGSRNKRNSHQPVFNYLQQLNQCNPAYAPAWLKCIGVVDLFVL